MLGPIILAVIGITLMIIQSYYYRKKLEKLYEEHNKEILKMIV
jgi:hypothetical protein